jgi:hypothetical protein
VPPTEREGDIGGGEEQAMAASRARLIATDWNTIRYELLNTRIADLGLALRASPMDPMVRTLYREMAERKLKFRPPVYLTDSWGCPNEVPVIGVPFYLSDRRLMRIEEEQTGEIEDARMIMMLLRHEAGHAVNYAYRLWERRGWSDTFGRFTKPYRDAFNPNPYSRDFVRHLPHSLYGGSYAQKHPDEDFAETFAVWLTPRSGWRRKYRTWPAHRKLLFVDRVMRGIRAQAPVSSGSRLLNPVDELTMPLAQHYGQRAERYRAAAQGYVDDKLAAAFPPVKGRGAADAADLVARHRDSLLSSVSRWSNLDQVEVVAILDKLDERSRSLHLRYAARESEAKLMELASLATSLAVDFSYTGRFTV